MVETGSHLGRYHVGELLGEGGMGRVHRAYDAQLRRRVALKIIKSDEELDALPGPRGSAHAAERLMREARIVAGLNHPNIAAVYDVGEIDGTKFIAMELLDGASLRSWIESRDVPLTRRIAWLLDIARALEATHAHGVVHRDIKPENVLIGANGVAKLLDFGIAKQLVSLVDTAAPTLDRPPESLTDARHVVGTPQYMSPEQAMGNRIDEKSDQYTWGVLAYELLTGVHPMQTSGFVAGGFFVPRDLRERAPDVPLVLAEVVSRATSVAPLERFDSFREIVRALEELLALEGGRVAAGPPGPVPVPAPTPSGAALAQQLEAGSVLGGKYRVVRVVGRGGMGTVVLAHHRELDQQVAIKVLTGDAADHPEAIARFNREARAAARLHSEHVVRVTDVGRWEGIGSYIVMEYLEGVDLQHLLAERGPLPIERAIDYVVEAAQGLAEAHRQGVVHRDLKPSNLFLAKRPNGSTSVKVLDFGISKMDVLGEPASNLTSTRTMMGTPHYMSPEQLRSAKEVDGRADVWSLGVVLYQLLTAERPFDGETVGALFTAIIRGELVPPRARRPDIPPALEAIILRCLRHDPRERFESMTAFAEALHPFGSGRTLLERKRDDSAPDVSVALHASFAPSAAVGFAATPHHQGSATQGAWGTPVPRTRSAARPLLFAAIPVALVTLGVGVWLTVQGVQARHARGAAAAAAAAEVRPAPSTTSPAVVAPSAAPVTPAASGAAETGGADAAAPSSSPSGAARPAGKGSGRKGSKPAGASSASGDLVNQRDWF